jgi:Phosphorylase superfamily
MVIPPILDNKLTSMPSVFAPAALLREARRQKGLETLEVPPVCILDPDGDLVRQLRQTRAATPFAGWPCYHTELDTFDLGGHLVGIVGRVVGASFAVLVAEELFASGCQLLVSLTSAGQIVPAGQPPYFVVIDRALRDEGTSYHYAPPSEFAEADPVLVEKAAMALAQGGLHGVVGASWRPFGRPHKPSRLHVPKASSRWRWKRRPYTLLLARSECECFASLTSPTPWGKLVTTSRKAKQMALGTPWPLSR